MGDVGPAKADSPYWAHLAEDRLTLPRCSDCRAWAWPARWRCGDCGAWVFDWEDVPARGRVYSYAVTQQAFGAQGAPPPPFVNVLVALDAVPGVRLLGLMSGAGKTVAIGDAVEGEIVPPQAADGLAALRWRRARA